MSNFGTRKILGIAGIILAVVLVILGVVFGPKILSSYYLNQGIGAFDKNDYDNAVVFLNRSAYFNSSNPEAYFYLGKIALGKPNPNPQPDSLFYPNADYGKAKDYFEKSVSSGIEKENAVLYKQLLTDSGFSYWMLKQYDKSDEMFLKKIAIDPAKSFLARYLVSWDYYNRIDKPKDGFDILIPAPSLALYDVQKIMLFRVYTLLARYYGYFGDYGNAEKYANLAIKTVPETVKSDKDIQIANVILAQVAVHKGDFDLAQSYIAEANKISQSKTDYSCYLAKEYGYVKEYAKAISLAEKTTGDANKPISYFVCFQALAESYYALGQKDKANIFFQNYLNATDKLPLKNVFIMRARSFAEKVLKGL